MHFSIGLRLSTEEFVEILPWQMIIRHDSFHYPSIKKRVKSLTSFKIRRGGENSLELYVDFTVIKGYF
jgi:hypothetical protein